MNPKHQTLEAFKCLSAMEADKLEGWFWNHSAVTMSTVLERTNRRRANGSDMLEIGSYHGKSAFFIAHYLRKSETLYCCDLFAKNQEGGVGNHCDEERFRENASKYLPLIHGKLSTVKCDSIHIRQMLPEGKKFRFIHVDGNHTYNHTLNDLQNSFSMLHHEGVICLDDWTNHDWPQVGKALMDFMHEHKGKILPILCDPSKIYLAHRDSLIYDDLIGHGFPNAKPQIK